MQSFDTLGDTLDRTDTMMDRITDTLDRTGAAVDRIADMADRTVTSAEKMKKSIIDQTTAAASKNTFGP